MKELSAFMDELSSIATYLEGVKEALRAGAMPDMRGLEKRVGALCESLQTAEEPVQKKCLPELSTLIKTLDEVERDLHTAYSARALKGEG